ncbi:MAG: response regulator transcription factor [Flavobacteriales bacterium]|nr:response regulator transcription factor [Flavobacteriales bacterium]
MHVKLILADDHRIFLDGIEALLMTEPGIEILAKVQNGQQVLETVDNESEIDLMILDINMPVIDGIEITKMIKQKYPEIKVLILSMYKKSEFIKTLISAGADGYILKNSEKQVLLEAISTLISGERFFSNEIQESIIDSFTSKQFSKDIEIVELSEREKEVVQLIVQEKSTAEIADILHLSQHTINSHRKSILNKLDVKNAAGIFRYALQTGIVKGFDL